MTPRNFDIVLRPAELKTLKETVAKMGVPERFALARLLLSACEPCDGCESLDVEVESLRTELALARDEIEALQRKLKAQ